MTEAVAHQGVEASDISSIVHGKPIHFSNNVVAHPAGVSHTPEFYASHEREIQGLIAQSDFVIAEQDPLIASHLLSESVNIGGKKALNTSSLEFYDRLLRETWKQGKTLAYVDPLTVNIEDLGQGILVGGLLVASLETLSIGERLLKQALRREELTRRQALKKVGTLIGGLLLATANPYGEAVLREVGNAYRQDSTWSNLTQRNAGAMYGISLIAERNAVHGQGTYFIGAGHIEDSEYFAEHIRIAKETYQANAYSSLPEGSAFGPSPIRVWEPAPAKNTFTLIQTIERP